MIGGRTRVCGSTGVRLCGEEEGGGPAGGWTRSAWARGGWARGGWARGGWVAVVGLVHISGSGVGGVVVWRRMGRLVVVVVLGMKQDEAG